MTVSYDVVIRQHQALPAPDDARANAMFAIVQNHQAAVDAVNDI